VEPLELWQRKLSTSSNQALSHQTLPEVFHILVAVRPNVAASNPSSEGQLAITGPDAPPILPPAPAPKEPALRSQLLGGLVIKYFETTNCGFITHASLRNFDNATAADGDKPNTILRTLKHGLLCPVLTLRFLIQSRSCVD